ncbi:MAG: pyridoxamine 5'-phosphate oxidase [Leptospirales bacterium]
MHGDRQYFQNIRRDYLKNGLLESELNADPVKQFESWFNQAIDAKVVDGNALTLSTVSGGKPNARVVLLKTFTDQGFIFFTNYSSKKAKELEENPYASMLFYWGEMERQVKIMGPVKKVSREESAEYFETRPRESQIGAYSSKQSQTLLNREILENKYQELDKEYKGKDIPLPDFWGGFILQPEYFEFWQGRPNRLHDRLVYEPQNGSWAIRRLYP